jgi:hypothetical protein
MQRMDSPDCLSGAGGQGRANMDRHAGTGLLMLT